MNLVFFAKRGFLGNHYHNLVEGDTILRLSGETRGAQPAAYLDAKLNPRVRRPEEVCIFVKGHRMELARDGDYIDFSDAATSMLVPWLLTHPRVHVIAHSQYAYEYLRPMFPNRMVCIPQQHINWENALPTKKNEPLVAGYIGRPSHISVEIQNEIRETLKDVGMEFKVAFTWGTREDAIRFYQSIDILVLGGYGKLDANLWQITPTKMINAAAFGVPSIAFMRIGYREFEGYYTQFQTMDDLLYEVERLRVESYYQAYSARILARSWVYHISIIAELYRSLDHA